MTSPLYKVTRRGEYQFHGSWDECMLHLFAWFGQAVTMEQLSKQGYYISTYTPCVVIDISTREKKYA